jgi:hypothetical protein
MTVLAQATGRRNAVRSICASGLALLASLDLAGTFGRRSTRGGNILDRADEKGKKKRKKKRDPAGSRFATRVVISAPSDPLTEAEGSLVTATAECGGTGKVVSCGYLTRTEAEEYVNVLVQAVQPDSERSSCSASLLRTVEVGFSTSFKGTIQAMAICLV